MNKITDTLWISDILDVREMSVPTSAVVTVCQDSVSDNISDSCTYHYFNMSDGEVDGYGGECSYELFAEAVDTVRELLADGCDVLVHCHAGQSRSAAVCGAVVAHIRDCPFEEGLAAVSDARPIIAPNDVLCEYGRTYIRLHNN